MAEKAAKVEEVTDYWLNYVIPQNIVKVWVKTKGNDSWNLVQISSPEQALFLSNLLYSGKPVFYIKDANLFTQKSLSNGNLNLKE
jgi:hypothetical protein